MYTQIRRHAATRKVLRVTTIESSAPEKQKVKERKRKGAKGKRVKSEVEVGGFKTH